MSKLSPDAVLEPVEQEQLVVAMDGVGAEPGVEAVEAREAGGEEGHDAPEELRPDHELLKGGEVGDRRCAVRVGRRARPQTERRLRSARGARRRGEVRPERGWQRAVERRVDAPLGQHPRVDGLVDARLVEEDGRAVGSRGIALVDEADHPAVGVDPVREDATRSETWWGDSTSFGSFGKSFTFVKPRCASIASRASFPPASSWCVSWKRVSSASIASKRTEIPRLLMHARSVAPATAAAVEIFKATVLSCYQPAEMAEGQKMSSVADLSSAALAGRSIN